MMPERRRATPFEHYRLCVLLPAGGVTNMAVGRWAVAWAMLGGAVPAQTREADLATDTRRSAAAAVAVPRRSSGAALADAAKEGIGCRSEEGGRVCHAGTAPRRSGPAHRALPAGGGIRRSPGRVKPAPVGTVTVKQPNAPSATSPVRGAGSTPMHLEGADMRPRCGRRRDAGHSVDHADEPAGQLRRALSGSSPARPVLGAATPASRPATTGLRPQCRSLAQRGFTTRYRRSSSIGRGSGLATVAMGIATLVDGP